MAHADRRMPRTGFYSAHNVGSHYPISSLIDVAFRARMFGFSSAWDELQSHTAPNWHRNLILNSTAWCQFGLVFKTKATHKEFRAGDLTWLLQGLHDLQPYGPIFVTYTYSATYLEYTFHVICNHLGQRIKHLTKSDGALRA